MSVVCTYTLQDPRDNQVRYVGKSRNPRQRFRDHCALRSQESNTYKFRWVKSLIDLGLRPVLGNVAEWSNNEDACAEEKRIITHYRSLGVALTNITEGGEGACGVKQTPEHIQKRVLAKKGKPLSAQALANLQAARLAIPHEARSQLAKDAMARMTPEQRQRISKAGNDAIKNNPHIRAKMIASSRARRERERALGITYPISDETRAKMSRAAREREAAKRKRGFVVSGKARANLSKAMKARTPETMARIREARQAPDRKRQASEGQKQGWQKRREQGTDKHSEQTRGKISAAHRARAFRSRAERAAQPPEHILCICGCGSLMNARGPKGYKRQYIPGHQSKKRFRHQEDGYSLTLEKAAKLRESLNRARADPDIQAKRLANLRAKMADPEVQARRSIALRAAAERKRQARLAGPQQLTLF